MSIYSSVTKLYSNCYHKIFPAQAAFTFSINDKEKDSTRIPSSPRRCVLRDAIRKISTGHPVPLTSKLDVVICIRYNMTVWSSRFRNLRTRIGLLTRTDAPLRASLGRTSIRVHSSKKPSLSLAVGELVAKNEHAPWRRIDGVIIR